METLIEVNKREANWILIFEMKWELDETNADKTFASIYEWIGDFSGNKKVILDMWGLKYLNSKSIGYLAEMYEMIVENNDGWLYISNCEEEVRDILDMVGMIWYIPVVDSIEEAIEELS